MLFTEKLRPKLDGLQFDLLKQQNIEADVLRLDMIDPVISGNKWFKLKKYLQDALLNNKSSIITFGGPYSNHIVATAALCKKNNLRSVGIIRGEQPKSLSPTLLNAMELGMDLFFVSREKYKAREIPAEVYDKYYDSYLIDEGGYGALGMKGAMDILQLSNAKTYTHILSAVGTGTTLAGLIESTEKKQQVIGIPVLKDNFQLQDQIKRLLSPGNNNRVKLLYQYHFGGYAKYDISLIDFMNEWYGITGIPSDFVYTGKLFYGFWHLLSENFFPQNSKVLLIHSGGLQGNCSLKKGTLIF